MIGARDAKKLALPGYWLPGIECGPDRAPPCEPPPAGRGLSTVLRCRPEGSELKTTGFCQWSAPNRVVYQPGGRGVPAGTSARVEWQTSGASPVGETRLSSLLFSDLLAEGAGNGTFGE